MNEFVQIDARLLAQAAALLSPDVLVSGPGGSYELRRTIVEALAQNIEDNEPFCDHSVGICNCGPRDVLNELRLLLQGYQTCRTCGGDGWLPDGPEAPRRPAGYGGGLGPENDCPTCHGAGRVTA